MRLLATFLCTASSVVALARALQHGRDSEASATAALACGLAAMVVGHFVEPTKGRGTAILLAIISGLIVAGLLAQVGYGLVSAFTAGPPLALR